MEEEIMARQRAGKIKQVIALMLVSILLVFSATGCGKTSSAKKEEQIVFRMAIVDGEASPIYKGAKKMADEVLKKTNGRIKIVVVTGGALGDERGSVELCSQGDLDIASAANSVLTNWIPEMNILDQAYLWENEEQAHAAVDGPLGDLIEKAAYDKLNVHVIGYLESGFRDTFSKKPIKTMSDFKGIKIRTMQNQYHMAAFQSFGAMPTAMAYNEVFTALQQGTIDACENAVSNCLSNGYYEVTKNVTYSHHAFTYVPVMISDKAWKKIPKDLQDEFMEGCKEGYVAERQYLKEENDKAVTELKKKGVKFWNIDMDQLRKAYKQEAKEKNFTFDPKWQAAVDQTIKEHPTKGE
jgi:tripartite ATP-independent transporter DctP family solute receptor